MAEKTNKRKNESMAELPKLKINVERLLNKVETNKSIYVTYASEIEGCAYVAVAEEGVVVVTRDDGYLKIPASELESFVEEISWIEEDLKRRRRN